MTDSSRYLVSRFAALWCTGLTLRLTVLAVPPLSPRIQDELGLTQAELAAFTTLPVLLLAVGAPVGAALIARTGPRTAVVAGLVVIAASSGLRGMGGMYVLFALTFVMGMAIAAIQPAMPDLVQTWVPARAGRATATWVNGMLVGEVLAAALTLPVVLPLAGQSWRIALGLWSLPVVAVAVFVGVLRGRGAAAHRPTPVPPGERRHWLPQWRSGTVWRLGLLQGASSVVYFGVNAFLPSYLHQTGQPALVGAALTTLNAAQLPATVLLAVVPTKVTTGRGFIAALGVGGLLGVGVMVSGGAWAVLVGAALTGFAAGAGITVAFTLPVLVAAPGEAHRVSAGMITIGYALAFVLPLLGGVAWDLTGVPVLGFLPALVSAAGMLVLAPTMRRAP